MKIYRWEVQNPIACVQLVHGAKEHIKRYDDFIKYLNLLNISVYGHNNQGHGQRLKTGNYIFEDNEKLYTEVNDVTKDIIQNNPNTDIILIGHSMGAVFAKKAYENSPKLYNKLILIGISCPSLNQIKLITKISSMPIFRPDSTSIVLDFLFFSNFELLVRLKGYQKNWICSDKDIVKKYKDDPYCDLLFTNNSLREYLKVAAYTPIVENNINKIPILLLTGEFDPVTSFTKTTSRLYKSYRQSNYDVILKIYPQMKHEVLNEKNKKLVYTDIIKFIKKK